MVKSYSVVSDGGAWLVVHSDGDVIARTATREAAVSSADRANFWAVAASTLGIERRVPPSVVEACA